MVVSIPRPAWSWALPCALIALAVRAQPFQFPTANHALLEKDGVERFFVGTVGKPWTSGTFGCVRSDGWQLHEGLDIRCLQRDKRGEPSDPVLATADGTVVYISTRPSLSNYGNFLVVRHQDEGDARLPVQLQHQLVDLLPGAGVQVPRSSSATRPCGMTRSRLPARPPPVTWQNVRTWVSAASARQSLA